MPRYTEAWENGALISRTDIADSMTTQAAFTIRLAESRQIAGEKIEALVGGAVEQRNAMAMAQYLQRKESNQTISPEEVVALDAHEGRLLVVLAIRNASNAIEAEILALQSAVEMLDYNIENNPLWP